MSETSEESRQEAVNSCLFVMIIRSKNKCFTAKEKMLTLNCFKVKKRNYVVQFITITTSLPS